MGADRSDQKDKPVLIQELLLTVQLSQQVAVETCMCALSMGTTAQVQDPLPFSYTT